MSNEPLVLFETSTCKRFGSAEHLGLDVYFPPGVGGWTDVLDCREEPYTSRTVEENCLYALHVRKKFILVEAASAETGAPSSSSN